MRIKEYSKHKASYDVITNPPPYNFIENRNSCMGVIFFAYFEILVRNIYDKKYIYFWWEFGYYELNTRCVKGVILWKIFLI